MPTHRRCAALCCVPQSFKDHGSVDRACPSAPTTHVFREKGEAWDVMLSQQNPPAPKEKYVIIQLLESNAEPRLWLLWVRCVETSP